MSLEDGSDCMKSLMKSFQKLHAAQQRNAQAFQLVIESKNIETRALKEKLQAAAEFEPGRNQEVAGGEGRLLRNQRDGAAVHAGPADSGVSTQAFITVDVLQGPHTGTVHYVKTMRYAPTESCTIATVGREEGDRIGVLLNQDEEVSSKHGTLKKDGNDYVFKSCSTNGTFDVLANNKRLNATHCTFKQDGALLQMGESVLHFKFPAVEDAPTIRAAARVEGEDTSYDEVPNGKIRVAIYDGPLSPHERRSCIVEPAEPPPSTLLKMTAKALDAGMSGRTRSGRKAVSSSSTAKMTAKVPCKFGRMRTVENQVVVVVDHEETSVHHGVVSLVKKKFCFMDTNSTNGTFDVGTGERLESLVHYIIENGAKVRFGMNGRVVKFNY